MINIYFLENNSKLLRMISHELKTNKQTNIQTFLGFPRCQSGKEPTYKCRRQKRSGFGSWVRKIPWSRKWQPSPVFLSGKSNGQRNLVGYSPSGHRFGHDWSNTHTQKPSCTKLTWVAHLKLLAIVKAKNPFSSVQFSLSVISNFSRPHEPQHARPPCPSPTPRIYSN